MVVSFVVPLDPSGTLRGTLRAPAALAAPLVALFKFHEKESDNNRLLRLFPVSISMAPPIIGPKPEISFTVRFYIHTRTPTAVSRPTFPDAAAERLVELNYRVYRGSLCDGRVRVTARRIVHDRIDETSDWRRREERRLADVSARVLRTFAPDF